jgi:hypothetical protein
VVIVIVGGLCVLSVASGMLGLGVAVATVPFLQFFMLDLVHQVQPLSLFLNGAPRCSPPSASHAAGPWHGARPSYSRR